MNQKVGIWALCVVCLLGGLFFYHRLKTAQREGQLYYGRQHRYVHRGEPEFDGLVTSHRMAMLFLPLMAAGLAGAALIRRG